VSETWGASVTQAINIIRSCENPKKRLQHVTHILERFLSANDLWQQTFFFFFFFFFLISRFVLVVRTQTALHVLNNNTTPCWGESEHQHPPTHQLAVLYRVRPWLSGNYWVSTEAGAWGSHSNSPVPLPNNRGNQWFVFFFLISFQRSYWLTKGSYNLTPPNQRAPFVSLITKCNLPCKYTSNSLWGCCYVHRMGCVIMPEIMVKVRKGNVWPTKCQSPSQFWTIHTPWKDTLHLWRLWWQVWHLIWWHLCFFLSNLWCRFVGYKLSMLVCPCGSFFGLRGSNWIQRKYFSLNVVIIICVCL
jgi:hypothetical protein